MSVNQGAEGQAVLPALAGRKKNASVPAHQLDRAAQVHFQHYKHLLLQRKSSLYADIYHPST